MPYKNRIQDTSTTTGTGNITVSGTPAATFQALSAFTNGTSGVPLVIKDTLNNLEISYCTILSSTTFSRDTVIYSTNSNALVNFPAGTKTIFNTLPAEEIAKFASATSTLVTTIVDSSTSTTFVEESGIAKRITLANLLNALGSTVAGLSAASTLALTDVMVTSQDAGVTEVKTNIKAITSVLYPSVNISSNTTLSVANHHKTCLYCTAALTLTSFTASASTDGFFCDVVNTSAGVVTLSGFTTLTGATTIPANSSANIKSTASYVYALFATAAAATGPTLTYASISNSTPAATGVTVTYNFTNGAPTTFNATLNGSNITFTAGPTITTTSGSGATAAGTVTFQMTNPSAATYVLGAAGTGTYASTAPNYNLTIAVAAPGAVVSLAAGTITTTTVQLTWAAGSGGTATSWNVTQRTPSGSGSYVSSTLSVAATATGCTVSSLTTGSAYDFQVTATNATGTSAATTLTNITPTGVVSSYDTFVGLGNGVSIASATWDSGGNVWTTKTYMTGNGSNQVKPTQGGVIGNFLCQSGQIGQAIFFTALTGRDTSVDAIQLLIDGPSGLSAASYDSGIAGVRVSIGSYGTFEIRETSSGGGYIDSSYGMSLNQEYCIEICRTSIAGGKTYHARLSLSTSQVRGSVVASNTLVLTNAAKTPSTDTACQLLVATPNVNYLVINRVESLTAEF